MPTPITASTLSALLSAALAQKPTRPVGAAGGGVFCAVRHSRKRGFCGGDHSRRDDLKCAPLRGESKRCT